MKIPVVTSKDYIFYFEHFESQNVFHCDVFKWNKTVKKALLKDFDLLCSIYRKDIYCLSEPTNSKLLKFAALLGFSKFTNFLGTDGVLYTLFIRRN